MDKLHFMQTPTLWPIQGVLALKRYVPNRNLPPFEYGVILAYELLHPVVYRTENIDRLASLISPEIAGMLPQHKYENLEAVLADGWVID